MLVFNKRKIKKFSRSYQLPVFNRPLIMAFIIGVMAIASVGMPDGVMVNTIEPRERPQEAQNGSIPLDTDLCGLNMVYCPDEDIETLIRSMGGDNNAVRIARCESRMGNELFNPKSTAKGIYQFINSTWANYCIGDVLNSRDNIKCFLKQYPLHPSWWSECNDKLNI